jgi:hypothetical protein
VGIEQVLQPLIPIAAAVGFRLDWRRRAQPTSGATERGPIARGGSIGESLRETRLQQKKVELELASRAR